MQTPAKNETAKPGWAAETRTANRTWIEGASSAATKHWPEYLMEATGLAYLWYRRAASQFCCSTPGSAIRHTLPSAFARRLVTGVAMGLTAIALIYSPWGKQSGAHLNPSVTLTFFGLGKIEPWDAAFYVAARRGKLHGRHDFRCCSAV
jgi:hypothetical protein